MAIKLTKLDEAESFAGPVTLGVDTPPPETPPAVVTIAENELPVAASAAAIAHLRAVNAEGASVIATPRQLREMVGIDYSSLEEQVVPGEFAPDINGVKKQVYTKTVILSTVITLLAEENRGYFDFTTGIPNVSTVVGCEGTVEIGARETVIYMMPFKDMMYYAELSSANAIVIGGRQPLASVGKTIKLTAVIKYTKI